MEIIKRNILANFGGSFLIGVMGFIFVPIYLKFLGVEAFGLMGIFGSLLGLFALLDMGLSSTLNREMARLSVQPDKAQEMRDLLRTLEIPYWLVGVIIAAIMIFTSPLIANHWINAKNTSLPSFERAIALMGLCVAFQWPISLYTGGLMGLQQQLLVNAINVAIAIIRGVGAVLVLWLISPTVEAFFLWQILINGLNVGLLVYFLWKRIPSATKPPRFRQSLLRQIWRFAAGMTATSITATILMQTDKLLLSKLLSFEMFGYYVLANTVVSILYRFIEPVYSAAYPHFTRLVQVGNINELILLYHNAAKLVSVLVLPIAVILSLFSKEIIYLWTRNQLMASNTHLFISILTVGTALHCLAHIPYALMLAYRWTRLSLYANIVSIIVLIPLMIVFTKLYGGIGAAIVWLILNVGCLIVTIPLMYRRLLSNQKWIWYYKDITKPFLAAISIGSLGRIFITPDWSPWVLSLSIGTLGATTLLGTALAVDHPRVIRVLKSIIWHRKRRQKEV